MKVLSALFLALLFSFAMGCATFPPCIACKQAPDPCAKCKTECKPATCADVKDLNCCKPPHIPDMNIYFDTNSDKLVTTGDAYKNANTATLDRIAGILKDKGNDWLGVFIASRCDERGSDKLNIKLGDDRAKSVKKYLMDKGIAESRIKVISGSKENPLACGSLGTNDCLAINRSAAIYWYNWKVE